MNALPIPPPETLWEMFSYDPLHGHLYWRKRDSIRKSTRKPAGGVKSHGYRMVSINYSRYLHHRLVWCWFNGAIPDGLQVDHIDRVRSNDTISNLRLATITQNALNRSLISHGSSGHRGVHWYKSKSLWQAYISCRGKRYHLGYFADKQEAIGAYKAAALRLNGSDSDFLSFTTAH
jgi:hypothetical protein